MLKVGETDMAFDIVVGAFENTEIRLKQLLDELDETRLAHQSFENALMNYMNAEGMKALPLPDGSRLRIVSVKKPVKDDATLVRMLDDPDIAKYPGNEVMDCVSKRIPTEPIVRTDLAKLKKYADLYGPRSPFARYLALAVTYQEGTPRLVREEAQ